MNIRVLKHDDGDITVLQKGRYFYSLFYDRKKVASAIDNISRPATLQDCFFYIDHLEVYQRLKQIDKSKYYSSVYLPILFNENFTLLLNTKITLTNTICEYNIYFSHRTFYNDIVKYQSAVKPFILKYNEKIKLHYLPSIINYFVKHKVIISNIDYRTEIYYFIEQSKI